MEETNNQSLTPEQNLSQGLAALGFSTDREVSEPKATSTTETNRSESQSDAGDLNKQRSESLTQNNDSEQKTVASDSTSTEEGIGNEPQQSADQQKQQQQQRKPSRSEQRFQELANTNKGLKEKLARLEQSLSSNAQKSTSESGDKKTEQKHRIPPPPAPRYDKAQLQALQSQLTAKTRNGTATESDYVLLDETVSALNEWRDYDIKKELWETKNGQAHREYEGVVNYYRQEAVKRWPDLQNTDSELYKTYSDLKQRVPELLDRSTGDGDFLLASVASLVLKSKQFDAESGAMKTELEKLRKENASLRGKLDPISQPEEGAETSPKTGKKESIDQEFRRKMQEARRGQHALA